MQQVRLHGREKCGPSSKAGNELHCKNLIVLTENEERDRYHGMVRHSGNYPIPAALEMAARFAGKKP